MSRDKQIEEMACKKCLHFEACQIAFRNSKDLGIYDCTEEEYFNSTLDCDYYINNKDYRKASDVAREIGEEIQRMAEEYGGGVLFWKKMQKFATELKNKYIGEEQ